MAAARNVTIAEEEALFTRATGPTHVYGMGTKLMYRSLENEFEAQLQLEAECFADCAKRADYREGVAAFLEKRKAVFTGE